MFGGFVFSIVYNKSQILKQICVQLLLLEE